MCRPVACILLTRASVQREAAEKAAEEAARKAAEQNAKEQKKADVEAGKKARRAFTKACKRHNLVVDGQVPADLGFSVIELDEFKAAASAEE